MIVILTRMLWDIEVLFICISLMAYDFEYIFKHSLVIFIHLFCWELSAQFIGPFMDWIFWVFLVFDFWSSLERLGELMSAIQLTEIFSHPMCCLLGVVFFVAKELFNFMQFYLSVPRVASLYYSWHGFLCHSSSFWKVLDYVGILNCFPDVFL